MADTEHDPIEQLKQRLKAGGFDGLYFPGECGCHCGDLAPCGERPRDGDEWINDCRPAYLHRDTRPSKERVWLMKADRTPPTDAEWEDVEWAF